MKLIVVLCLAAVALAQKQNDVQILRYDNNNNGLGDYKFVFEQSDGTAHEQQGQLKNAGKEDQSISVQGKYSWVGPDGITYVVTYIADDKGYQPKIEQGPGGGVPAGVVASLLG